MLSIYGLVGDDLPFVRGSALQAHGAMKDNAGTKRDDNLWVVELGRSWTPVRPSVGFDHACIAGTFGTPQVMVNGGGHIP